MAEHTLFHCSPGALVAGYIFQLNQGVAIRVTVSRGAKRRGSAQMRKHSLGNTAALTFALVFLFSHACLAQEKISDAEKLLFDSVNRERAARELPLLKWDEGLARAARKHAELMAEQYLLLHRLPGEAELTARARQAGGGFSHSEVKVSKALAT